MKYFFKLFTIILFFIPFFVQGFSLRVLCYHNIVVKPRHNIDVSVKDFEEQMAYLYQENVISLTASELVELLKNPKKQDKNKKYVVITFDDGNNGVYTHAMPILKKYGIKATFYIYPSIIDAREQGKRKSFMTWAQIKELVNIPGFELGCHSYYHPYLTKENHKGLILNTKTAQEVIEQKTGQKAPTFAYPFGSYNKRVIEAVKKQGFTAAFTVEVNHTKKDTHLYKIPRIMFYSWFNLDFFKSLIKGEKLYFPKKKLNKKAKKS